MDRAAIKAVIVAAGYGTAAADIVAQDRAIDAVFLELAAEREWSWLMTSTTGVMTIGSGTIAKPSDLVVPKQIYPSQGTNYFEPLIERDADQMRRNQHLDHGTGQPAWWSWVNRTIAIWPLPDLAYAYTLHYIKEPNVSAFDADGESAPFNNQFNPVIAWGAIRWLAFRQRDLWSYWNASDEYRQAKLNFSQADRRGDQDYVVPWIGWGPA